MLTMRGRAARTGRGEDDSLALCRALVRDGITTAIATPHQLGRLERQNQPADVRRRVQELQSAVELLQFGISELKKANK